MEDESWQEITIAGTRHSLLAKLNELNTDEKITWTPISPIETVKVVRKRKYKLWIIISSIFFFFAILASSYYIIKNFKSVPKLNSNEDINSYLDVVSQSVSNDISSYIIEAKRIYKTEHIFEKDKDMVRNFIFPVNTKNLYFGIYGYGEEKLNSEIEFFNEHELGLISLTGEIIRQTISLNEINLLRSKNGNVYLHNFSLKGYSNVLSILSIPVENSKILILVFNSTHWTEILSSLKKGTYFLINDYGIVISHSDFEVASSGPDYSDLEFLKFIFTEKPHNTTRTVISKAGKSLVCSVKKIINADTYLVYLKEEVSKDKFPTEMLYLFITSLVIFIVYCIILLKIFRNAFSEQ
ncbi:MAG: hypothetical protein KDK36_07025 [Leptospiraceae bacterium]|nr:hypothetical protein [Leptospiraceae bacterium]